MCNLYKHTFTKADVFLQDEKINLSAGFLFLCAFSFFWIRNYDAKSQPHAQMDGWYTAPVVVRRLLFDSCLFSWVMKYNCAVVHFFVSVHHARRLLFRVTIAGSEETQKRGFRVQSRAVLSWCMLLHNGGPWQASAPAQLSSASTLSLLPVGTSHVYKAQRTT